MSFRRRRRTIGLASLALVGSFSLFLATPPARAQYGIAISGVGPINRSMGGASVAAPLDSAGALYWNPATIGALKSEMEFGIGFLIPRTTLTSQAPAGAFGPNAMQGTNSGNNGIFLLPVIGVVYNPEDSPWSYGLGIYEIGGFAVNYPVSRTNPVLTPGAPFGTGLGPIYTQLQLFQFSPTAALKVSDQFYLGFQANIDYGLLYINPALNSTPALVQTPHGPSPAYLNADQGRSRAGAGFQIGGYYIIDDDWSVGASFKSPQWFDTYRFNSVNPGNGNPATPMANIDFPLTGSVGFAYKGIENLLWATDFRILDYRDTNGFRSGGFNNQTGALNGLGWQNVFAVATGVQYQFTPDFSARIGYSWNLNPIGPAMTTYNIGSPLIIQNSLAVGASYNITPAFKVSLAWSHDFWNSITGPIVEPFVGRIAGSSVHTSAVADTVYMGATVTF